MNASPNPTQTVPDDLNERYKQLLTLYDTRAIHLKNWLFTMWGLSIALTCIPLLLAIAVLSGGLPSLTPHILGKYILPFAGVANAAVAVTQLLFVFRGRWLKYRAATERLRENCMRFRTFLKPFHKDDAVATFRKSMDELEREIGKHPPFRWQDLVQRYSIGMHHLPTKLRKQTDHAPDQGLAPRLDGDLEAGRRMIIEERLRNQQRWHLVKAGIYSRRYLALQTGVILMGLLSGIYGRFFGDDPGPTMILTLIALFLIAYREQMAYGPMCLRYTRIADTLEQIETEYESEWANTLPTDVDRRRECLRNIAARIEQTLASEFQYWHFGAENIGSAWST